MVSSFLKDVVQACDTSYDLERPTGPASRAIFGVPFQLYSQIRIKLGPDRRVVKEGMVVAADLRESPVWKGHVAPERRWAGRGWGTPCTASRALHVCSHAHRSMHVCM